VTARRSFAAVVGAAAFALTAPIAAQAATKTVTAGPPRGLAKTLQPLGTDVNGFFPHRVTIRAGDSVRFSARGFHTVDLPGRQRSIIPVFAPTGQTIGNVADPAGVPWWFNGQPQVGFNAALAKPLWGSTRRYTGRSRVNSGLPVGPNVRKPFTVRFARKGTYMYLCDVHAGMKGVVKVVGKNARVPSRRADRRTLATQVRRDLRIARGLQSKNVPAFTVDVGVGGRFGVEMLAMSPQSLSVPAGTTVRFRMTPGSLEVHTATFGPGSPEQAGTFLGTLEATFNGPVPDQSIIYQSENPGTTTTISPTLHGNGFWNSGALDAAGSSPLPESSSVKFDTPGTYTYYCLIHPFMRGTVTVQ
jgi:plastocyanin